MAQSKPKTPRVRQRTVKKESLFKRGLRQAANVGNICYKIMVLFFLWQIAGGVWNLNYGLSQLMEMLWVRM